jgi:hypothetical protein
MATVRHLIQAQLETTPPHSESDCTYSLVATPGGKCLQIDTYGSSQRQMPGKKSQSIRFAPEAIEELKTILAKHFT